MHKFSNNFYTIEWGYGREKVQPLYFLDTLFYHMAYDQVFKGKNIWNPLVFPNFFPFSPKMAHTFKMENSYRTCVVTNFPKEF